MMKKKNPAISITDDARYMRISPRLLWRNAAFAISTESNKGTVAIKTSLASSCKPHITIFSV